MSTGSGSSSKKRGQYVSRACNECRRRRCKCDGGQPTCGTCTFYDRECTWSTENDARRPATKQLVESLHVKIQALEAELAQLKIRHGIPLTESTSVPPSPLDGTSVLPLETQEPVLPAATHTATVMYRYLFEIDNDIQANEQPNDARLSLVCQWNRYLPQIPQLSRLEHDMILSRFFKYGASWLHCMAPESFLHDMLFCLTSELSAEGHLRLQYYTPFLHCSILAYASALSDNADLRSLHVRAQFAQHARQWLDSEFERPSMSLVHALTLLGEYRSGIGEREAGFMYTGMGFCTARTLVLDLDKESRYSEGASVFSESTDGDWHFWSAFAQDKIMALEYRQEYDIPVPHAGVGLPSIDVESDSLPWSDSETGFSPRLVTKVFFETCKLMVISTKIIDYLHNRDPEAANERVVINTHLQLDTWFNNLPRELLVWARSTSPLPHMIVLHICYWHLIICLHQPLYGRVFADGPSATATTDGASGVDGAGEGGIGQTPIHDLSIKMSDRATHKIVQLLQMYESQHGMASFPGSMIHAIQQCGLALLREAAFVPISATKKRSNALSGATACMRALRGVAASWPWAAHLATDLEGKLRESGVNITMSPFASTIPVPPPNENDPSAMDISQSLYQSIHAWEPMTVDGGATERLQGLGLQAGPSRLGMQASSSTTGAGPSRLGPQSLAPGATVTTNPGMSGGAGSIGSHQGVFDGRAYNMPSFSGTPPGSSTSSYSMGGEGMNEGMWEPPLFE